MARYFCNTQNAIFFIAFVNFIVYSAYKKLRPDMYYEKMFQGTLKTFSSARNELLYWSQRSSGKMSRTN
jgi:hypothetical protein